MDMELLYVWIDKNESGFIQNQGFHFSPEYRFTMRSCEAGYELSCVRNDNSRNVWKTGNLIGLTAVVGENGTGKTTLINALLTPDDEDAMLMVYQCDGELYVRNRLGCDVRYRMEKNQKMHELLEDDFAAGKPLLICMTNAQLGRKFDVNDFVGEAAVFAPYREMRRHFGAEPWSSGEMTELYRYGGIEFDRLAVIYYYHRHFEKPDAPGANAQGTLLKRNSTLTIDVSRSLLTILNLAFSKHRSMLAGAAVQQNRYREEFRKSRVTDRFWMLLLTDLYFIAGPSVIPDLMAGFGGGTREFVEGLLKSEKLKNRIDPTLLDHYVQAAEEVKELQGILETAENAENAQKGAVELVYDEKNAVYKDVYQAFCKYITGLLHKKNSFVLGNISIGMPELSSGERAMQNICAWLTVASNSTVIGGNQNILLLLDEIDLYMHPEWQRKFLYFLSEELKSQFPDYHIQIVLTTHSPLVLSDVPSGNIIYLGKKSDQCRVEERTAEQETFGANIFTLLKDSFYLERTLGEFAYTRIHEVIEDLQKLKNWDAEAAAQKPADYQAHWEKCRKHRQLIEIIGEPVVRGKLQRLYAELFPEEQEARFQKQVTNITSMLAQMAPADKQTRIAELQSALAAMQEEMN